MKIKTGFLTGVVFAVILVVTVIATAAPTAPQSLTVTPGTSPDICLSWSAPITGVPALYSIYKSFALITDANKSATPMSHVVGSETSYVDSTGTPGWTYFYAVSAVDDLGAEGPVSNSPGATVAGSENPHGNWGEASDLCDDCHTGHKTRYYSGLNATSQDEICFVCHDGTGSQTDIKSIYQSPDIYAGHRTQTGGVLPAGSQLFCIDCHTPHDLPAENRHLIKPTLLAPSPGRNYRDVCIMCHANDPAEPEVRIEGITLSHITTTQDITHAVADTTQCKKCHANLGDAQAAHSPTIVTKSTEAETINVWGSDAADASASGGYKVVHQASTSAFEVVLNYYGATGGSVDIPAGNYSIRARVKSTTLTAAFKGAVGSAIGPAVTSETVDTWAIVDLGSFAFLGVSDNFQLGVRDENAGTVEIDKVYFCRN